jgi:hypothetical protein
MGKHAKKLQGTLNTVSLDEEIVAYKCDGWHIEYTESLKEFSEVIESSLSGFVRLEERDCEGGWREANDEDDAYYVCVAWGDGTHTPLPVVLEMYTKWERVIKRYPEMMSSFEDAEYTCAVFEADQVTELETPDDYYGEDISDATILQINSHEIVVRTPDHKYNFHLEDGRWHCVREDGGSPVWASSDGIRELFKRGRASWLCLGWDRC